ncbi:MAG: class I SAM-dependent methyltransferase [Candidatus Peribacteraceae bacterium]|nr:class I SAM-dependent methyltransferase [Candidatus Peribacteraceae bacterium]MDD5075026.1 class I SAM-dependent methyltransferase [Candidatus Peribacteraceae bacterium]
MDYSQHTLGSRNPLKRWLHRQRFAASVRLLGLSSCHSFLDYGCGNGELSAQIARLYPALRIIAYDPAEELYLQAVRKLSDFPNVKVIRSLDAVEGTFDRIACLETVEHLPTTELERVFTNIHRLLVEGGLCLFTFPIEHGLISLIKNLYRAVSGRDPYVSFGRAVRSLFGLRVERESARSLSDCRYLFSHIGFDCRTMIDAIGNHFSIHQVAVLPAGFICCGLGNGVAVTVGK